MILPYASVDTFIIMRLTCRPPQVPSPTRGTQPPSLTAPRRAGVGVAESSMALSDFVLSPLAGARVGIGV